MHPGGKAMKIPDSMRAMVLQAPGGRLRPMDLPVPQPGPGQVLIRVAFCGVCRTDLHILDGELAHPKPLLVPGHEVAGRVVQTGAQVKGFKAGDRIGVPWLGFTCGECRYCRTGQENLCDRALFTGYTLDGGYAEYMVADQRYCFRLPEGFDDATAAPLLCAGLIGYRSYRMAGDQVENLGVYGFGAAAHIIAQIAVYQGKRVYAFTRPGDIAAQEFARRLGASWAGDSASAAPEELDAAIIFAPVGALVPAALRATRKGGTVVCGGIHMSDIPSFPYALLWQERVVRSVANLTRRDGEELLELAAKVPVKTEVEILPLEQANEALERLRRGELHGAAVLRLWV
jgi:propanol-preferring alcohol dehydrogenase